MSDHEDRDRFSLYRLCLCPECEGTGKVIATSEIMVPVGVSFGRNRCPECRGEGRVRQEVASCDSAEAEPQNDQYSVDGKPKAFRTSGGRAASAT